MASYDPLLNHPVKSALDNLLALETHDNLSPTNPAIDDARGWGIGRVFSIANHAKLTIDRLDPSDANLGALDGLTNSLNKSHAELSNFISNSNAAHIDNARNQMENGALIQVRRLVPLGSAVHPKTEAALESYRRKFQDASRRQARTTKEATEQLAELKKTLEEEVNKVSALSNEVAAQKSENETLLSELRKADIARVEESNKELKDSLITTEKRLSSFLGEKEKQLKSDLEKSNSKAAEAIEKIEQSREDARKIVQSVGDLLTTGTYADRADTETKKADTFRNITVGLFAFGLVIIVSNYLIYGFGIAFGKNVNLAESWQSLAARIATGLAVTLPAFYTARESARHRTNADVAKQRELELMTLGPFIELLPDDQKAAIRDRLTDRYFGGEIDPHDVKAPVDLDALAKTIVNSVAKPGGVAPSDP